ncbi:PREDICTED: fatty acyl-CoA reductase 1-like [Vollenhovia emeryi]|uniref:fatty acyl-CoA reductase 1-like n=1 Tax=Vollenhovia emeryi TaxID=411798 RepID=UPI0005F4F0BB|nr:PREDICTED: fatty acyl-CoA reductase 1-like [Vollenhovia emeryi]
MLIDRVSVIFHCAATVRFDEDLKDAIFSNTRSTQDICILAENMKQLVVLIHVSTTYGQCDKPVVKEMLYPTEFDWKKAIKIAESVDDYLLKILTAKYMKNIPNTYILSKILAEQVISDYSKSLPCVIIRPSIVISTMEDPFKGWIDNFNGPVGLLIGGSKGLVRTFYADSSIISDYMPVDLVIKAMIIAAWKRGIQPKNNIVDVYHCSSNGIKSLSLRTITNVGLEITKDIPFENVIWKSQTIITNSNFIYYILLLLLHVIPAIILDGILKLIGARPM